MCEFCIARGIGADRVHRAAKIVVGQCEEEDVDQVIKGDPAPILTTATHFPAESKTKRGQHGLECAALRGEHDSAAQVHDADARVSGWRSGMLPFLADIGKK